DVEGGEEQRALVAGKALLAAEPFRLLREGLRTCRGRGGRRRLTRSRRRPRVMRDAPRRRRPREPGGGRATLERRAHRRPWGRQGRRIAADRPQQLGVDLVARGALPQEEDLLLDRQPFHAIVVVEVPQGPVVGEER